MIVYGGYFNFGLPIEEVCSIAAAAPVLATGTVRLRWTVKDPAEGAGTFMEQIRINGRVILTDGNPAGLHGALKIIVSERGEERVFEERLSLVPIGGGN